MLYSVNWQNFIVWLSLILEILGNMSVEIFWEQKEFLRWNKSISIIFEGFSLTKTCLRPESAPLILHSWQEGPNPSYFLNTPRILPTPFFQILYNPTLPCCLQSHPNCFLPTPTALSPPQLLYWSHSGANRLTRPYKHIFTTPVMCWEKLSLLRWMNNSLISKIYFPLCLFCAKPIH